MKTLKLLTPFNSALNMNLCPSYANFFMLVIYVKCVYAEAISYIVQTIKPASKDFLEGEPMQLGSF